MTPKISHPTENLLKFCTKLRILKFSQELQQDMPQKCGRLQNLTNYLENLWKQREAVVHSQSRKNWERTASIVAVFMVFVQPQVKKHIAQILAPSLVLVNVSGVEIALRHKGRPWSEVAAVRSDCTTQSCTSDVCHFAVILHSPFLSIKIIHQLLPIGHDAQDGSNLITIVKTVIIFVRYKN